MFAEEPFFTNCFTKMCYNLVKGFSCCTTLQQGPNNTSLTVRLRIQFRANNEG